MPIKLQILTTIHVILNSEGIVILYTNIIKSYSICITTLTTLKWFAFTFLSDCTHITFYISKHMKQELSEVQKFFHECPLPTGKQPFVIRLHVHVHVLQRATCHLFIHCQLNGTATEKGKKNQLLELWACLCENNNQLNKTAGTVQVTKTRVFWSQFVHNIDLFLDCLCVSPKSIGQEWAYFQSFITIGYCCLYASKEKHVFAVFSMPCRAWFAPVPGHFIHVKSLGLQEYKMSVRL